MDWVDMEYPLQQLLSEAYSEFLKGGPADCEYAEKKGPGRMGSRRNRELAKTVTGDAGYAR